VIVDVGVVVVVELNEIGSMFSIVNVFMTLKKRSASSSHKYLKP
jgi:hypothetical protein